MIKKVIPVPMEERLITELDARSTKEGRSRSDLIREACRSYLSKAQELELDRLYQEGYRRSPEESVMGETQVAILGRVLPVEHW